VPAAALRIRDLREDDLPGVIRIDALRTGRSKHAYWRRLHAAFASRGGDEGRVALAAEGERGLAGYLLGEVRAFEFGSEPCGWVFTVAVDPAAGRTGVATALLEEACRRFGEAGVGRVRTMVGRDDVPFQSFFRARGFVGGPFVQLEREVGP
jgi:ribosomal protein S18 acetylase RimI-like enzyme